MKKIVGCLIISLFASFLITGNLFAQVELTYLQNAMWRIAADPDNYVSLVTTKLTNLNNYREHVGISQVVDDMVGWLKVELKQPGSLEVVYNDEVYRLFLSKFDYGSAVYGKTVVVDDDHKPPQNVTKNGTSIACSEDGDGRTISLFKWIVSSGSFVDTEKVAVCEGGTCTFSGLANGYYVVGFTGNEFPSLSQQISQ